MKIPAGSATFLVVSNVAVNPAINAKLVPDVRPLVAASIAQCASPSKSFPYEAWRLRKGYTRSV